MASRYVCCSANGASEPVRTQIEETRKKAGSFAHKTARISTQRLVGVIKVGLRRLAEKGKGSEKG